MSENTTTNAQTPDGLIGLSMSLGALRSDLNHHIEDQARIFDELRGTVSDGRAELESRIATLEAIVSKQVELLGKVVDATTQYTTTTKKPSTAAKSPTTAPPARQQGESNTDFSGRLAVWAEQRGAEAPPTPTRSEFTNSYNKRVSKWSETLQD